MRIACAQFDSVSFERDRNLKAAEAMVRDAVVDGAAFVVVPECFATGYEYSRRLSEFAETLDGPTLTWMKAISRENSIWLAGGIVERSEHRVYDSMVVVSPAGIAWTYRKRYLPFFEKLYFTRGRDVGLFKTQIGRIGVMLCWDMIHDRLLGELKGQIDLLVICSAWPDVRTGNMRLPGLENWLGRPPLNRPRELATLLDVPVVYCNRVGRFTTRIPGLGLSYSADFAGTSTIIDNGGHGTIGPHREQALVVADVDLQRTVDQHRRAA